jgi:peptide deformylase
MKNAASDYQAMQCKGKPLNLSTNWSTVYHASNCRCEPAHHPTFRMDTELKIIVWPDPRLKKNSEPVKEFTPALRELAAQMFELMRRARGVGLAAPQVGLNIRMFVMNPTGEPNDDRVYVNPLLSDPDGEDVAEEGCLSLPTINAQISRNKAIRIQAQDLEGKPFEQVESGYIARIWQHEFDHLNGVLITDRMGLGDRFKYRKTLKELQDKWDAEQPEARESKPKRKRRE